MASSSDNPSKAQRANEREPKVSQPQRVGLLAGWGRLPIVFAETAQGLGLDVYCRGVSGMADPQLADICHAYKEIGIARVGEAIRYFQRRHVDRVVMAGKVEKRVLFHPRRILKLLPDWTTLKLWYVLCRGDRKDDSLLLALIRVFAEAGIDFGSPLDICPELLVRHGFLNRQRPTTSQWSDIRFGWQLAREMGRLDIGQTVCVSESAVIAVEAIEGTDECIRRAGQLCRRGFTVVKVAKPDQDMRFDVPTVGTQTIEMIHKAGGKVLAIEAGKTILLDEERVLDMADRFRIAVVALHADEMECTLSVAV